MDFYVLNPELEQQITEIRRKIKLSMNGVVSEQMERNGIVYKQNYGVSIPRLREIASLYAKNHDLAQRLWALHIRETMILATLLEPEEKATIQLAEQWMKDVNQIELVEQICMNLFSKASFAEMLCFRFIQSGQDIWKQITGFTLSARIYQQLSQDTIKTIVSEGIKNSDTDNLFLYKSIALSLSRLLRAGEDAAKYILKEIEPISSSNINSQKYICHEVKEEALFLNIL
ncbi:hypothetical protein D0T49_04155 [Paludibacter sp. 221]|uniref:DNA alkylation repair protein n=1 Tax=Paludibacter sp. 221 TaxID=2302939 RepID=UPI0013D08990|nr:DNA alkylation repair protein [Paludibacter sp. 221]NDV46233.1 hypothetical protein [Paludibacter sp. 221]